MRQLGTNYIAEVDNINKDLWHKILETFDDANIYQTWSYGEAICGNKNISHLILKKDNEIVAVAQARIVKIPLINAGIAYIRWGPIWRLSGEEADVEIFCQAIRALRNEYVYKRGYVLRLFPLLYSDDSHDFLSLLRQEGYSGFIKEDPTSTILINLNLSLDDLRKGLKGKWRYHLTKAEKNDLEIIDGKDIKLFDLFLKIYDQMLLRKKYSPSVDINHYKLIQKKMPDNFKMKIFICMLRNEPCAGVICSVIGKTGLFLFGATGNKGLKNRASYLLHWKAIEALKSEGLNWYDLNGINPTKNPGTYQFKSGICSKGNGKTIQFLGKFDAYNKNLSFITVKGGEILKDTFRKIKKVTSHIKRLPK
jgi:lipid II:glycine glycyltransferase (peptidoglycan interpeptide bridge formation enzyme)